MNKPIRFILLTYLFSWCVWLPGVLSTYGVIGKIPWPPFFAIGASGPLVAAMWLIYRSEGWRGVRAWLKTGFTRRVLIHQWLLVVLIPLLVPAFVLVVYFLADGCFADLSVIQQPWLAFPTILLMVTIGGGQEEYGWRGYLLKHLQQQWGIWRADLMMILVHSLWHLPLFFIAYTTQSQYPFWLFLLFGVGFTLLANRTYNWTGNSIFATIVLHGMVNTGLELFSVVGQSVNHINWPFLLVSAIYTMLALFIHPWNPMMQKGS